MREIEVPPPPGSGTLRSLRFNLGVYSSLGFENLEAGL
jgi:hypothetical protein